MIFAPSAVYDELWVSLASLLRSYTAAHGLNHTQQATVELGAERITVRAGTRWLNLERQLAEVIWTRDNFTRGTMLLTLEGRLKAEAGEEEMDMQAEAWARELMQ